MRPADALDVPREWLETIEAVDRLTGLTVAEGLYVIAAAG
jgi:hypothetical protein